MKRFLLVFLLCTGSALAAESGSMIRASGLNAAPDVTSQRLGILRGQAEVTILEREGGWYRVSTRDGRTGWVRMANVRLGATTVEKEEESFWGSLFSFGSRSSSRTATATTGIRGLSEEDIQNAVPDATAVSRLQQWESNAAEARRHAGEAGLLPTDVKPLPEDK